MRLLGTHWPRAGYREAAVEQSCEHGVPASRHDGLISRLGLLKGIEERQWVPRILRLAHSFECIAKSLFEKLLRSRAVPVEPIRGCDEFLRLRRQQRAEKIGINRVQRPAEPEVEEIREVGVADVVVVRRVCRNKMAILRKAPRV